MTIAYLGTLMLGCVGLGWWAGRRAPEGVSTLAWRRMGRKLRRWRDTA